MNEINIVLNVRKNMWNLKNERAVILEELTL